VLLLRATSVPSAYAATFTVNTTADSDDGVCDAAHCTLREALNASNALAGKDLITFSAGSGPISIDVLSALPEITGSVTLDATTQPGYTGVPIVALNGGFAGAGVDGLALSGGSSEVRGFIIHGFSAHGLHIRAAGGNTIETNHIGLDPSGAPAGNGADGVWIDASSNNTIGGSSPSARNVISGNGAYGVEITGGSNGAVNRVRANYIGTDVSGMLAVPNALAGIHVVGDNNSIGDTATTRRNVISGNGEDGIRLTGAGTTQNIIAGNYIGVAADGSTPLPNGHHGVLLDNAIGHNTIGGTAAGAGNLIAHNGRNGIFVATGTGHPLLGNAIHSNGGLGIDLFDDAGAWGIVTPNDSGDGDGGANMRQNFPTLSLVTPSGGSVTIDGTLNSLPSQAYRLEFFVNDLCDGTNGEGASFIGSTNVTTDGSGVASFSVALAVAVAEGSYVTATARDGNSNTSEFSSCVIAGLDPTPTPTATLTSTATVTDTPIPTDTPTPTSTHTPSPTRTPLPTDTPEPPTSTHTPIAPSATPEPSTSTPEAEPTATPPLVKTPPRGLCGASDLNGDHRVDGHDVAQIVHALLKGKKDARFDVNGDGKVNGQDLKTVIKCADHDAN
jgi:CSLREA domain-containing protein